MILPVLSRREDTPRQRELPSSCSCLKLFLDRENPQRLNLGFGGGVGRRGVIQLLKTVSLAGVWIPSFREFFCMPPSSVS